jgi:hypothetical protein
MSEPIDRCALPYRCATKGIEAGRKIRAAVHALDPRQRGAPCTSLLKPKGNVRADALAEDIGIECLGELSRETGVPIAVIVDAASGTTYRVGSSGDTVIWASFDAVDGTVKVAGLGNDFSSGKFRAANDGAWAAAIAFTAPTTKSFADLTIGDFVAAALVDGNPTRHKTYPQEVVAIPAGGGIRTYEVVGGAHQPLFTSTNTDLSRAMVFLDSFQAYDLHSRAPGDEALAVALYRRLIDRHRGGAYDVLRQFGSLSALQRTMLGWRDDPLWYESQGGAFLVVNENLPNLLPCLPMIEGAGGMAIDFDGQPLRQRKLSAGRTSIAYVANDSMRDAIAGIILQAQADIASS